MNGSTDESVVRVVCGIRYLVDILPLSIFLGVGDQPLVYSAWAFYSFQRCLSVDANGSWTLNVEPVHFRADVDTAFSINAKLEEGLHVVLAAGIFNLDAPLQVHSPNTVILGFGMVTLVSSNGNAVISVADVPGIRVAGLLLNVGSCPPRICWSGEPILMQEMRRILECCTTFSPYFC